MLTTITATAHQIAFFAPPHVAQATSAVIRAATELVDTIESIRESSRPGHQGAIDQRHAARHQAAVDALDYAITQFATAGRADLEITGTYTPLELTVVRPSGNP